jgi:hypothetical protein
MLVFLLILQQNLYIFFIYNFFHDIRKYFCNLHLSMITSLKLNLLQLNYILLLKCIIILSFDYSNFLFSLIS